MDGEHTAGPLYARLLIRVKALVIDMAILALATISVVVAATAVSADSATFGIVLFWMGALFLYEPLMVWRYGGTIGHMRLNLRVVSDATGGNPSLLASLLRWLGKSTLGVPSFVSIALTRRHQSLHDTVSRTTVQVRDPGRARFGDFVSARSEPVGAVDVSAARRLLVIAAYQLVLFVTVGLASTLVASDACMIQDICTEVEDLAFSGVVLVWFVVAGVVIAVGWRGRLFGARDRAA